jgi:hypothetical protein
MCRACAHPAGPARFPTTPLSASLHHTIINPVATSRRGQQVSKTIERLQEAQSYTDSSASTDHERLAIGASFAPGPLMFSAFDCIPDTALDFLSLTQLYLVSNT